MGLLSVPEPFMLAAWGLGLYLLSTSMRSGEIRRKPSGFHSVDFEGVSTRLPRPAAS